MSQKHVIVVSKTGDDRNSGTADSPLATLEGARDALRVLKRTTGLPSGGATVQLRGGSYRLDASFRLDERDSGTADSPIRYEAREGEDVRLIGGVEVPGEQFTPVTDPDVRARLKADVREVVVQMDLRTLGIADFGAITQSGFGLPPKANHVCPPELFYNGQTMSLARYPNEGYVTVGEVLDPGGNPREFDGVDAAKMAAEQEKGALFRYADDRPSAWRNNGDIWMYGYWYWDWADGNLRVGSIDEEAGTVSTESASFYSMREGQRYYYYNVLEELDAPGEWYVDREQGMLYFYPPGPLDTESVQLSLLGDPMISMTGCSHVTFGGFTCEVSRGTGVQIVGGSNNRVEGCTLRRLAGYAVLVGEENYAAAGTATGEREDMFLHAGSGHCVTGCDIYETGIGGIALGGGDRHTLAAGRNEAVNNDISRYSRLKKTYSAAVQLSGTGNWAAHNYIHDAPHVGILLYGNDHIVEYNDICRVLTETGDAGAIYIGRDWTEQGNVIRYNLIRHIHNDVSELHIGIYLDDMASGVEMYGNVLHDIDLAVMIGGGRSNVLRDNLILNCRRSLQLDARSAPGEWAAKHSEPGQVMHRRLLAMPVSEEPWRSKYPALVTLWDDEPAIPKYNEVERNVVYRTGTTWYHGGLMSEHGDSMWIAPSARDTGTIRDNWVTKENLSFADEARENFTLLPDSPVWRAVPGFEPIPFGKIGLYKDAVRR